MIEILTILAIIAAILVIIIKKNTKLSGLAILLVGVVFMFDFYSLKNSFEPSLIAVPIVFIMIGVYFILIGYKKDK